MNATGAGYGQAGVAGLSHGCAGPTAARMLIGRKLRRLREAAGLTCEEAAQVIRGSASKISRLELGRTGAKLRDVTDLLALYGANAEQGAAMLTLARQTSKPGWWHSFGDVVPAWFEPYLGLEQAAAVIRTYEIQHVPGLLQTEGYARAVIGPGSVAVSPELTERRVALLMRRQERFRAGPASLWAVIDESVIHRLVGGPAIMRAQLRHLIEISQLPTVSVQILPLIAGQATAAGAVTLLHFHDDELPDVVYTEQLTGARYLDKPADTEGYRHALNELAAAALPPGATPVVLRRLLGPA